MKLQRSRIALTVVLLTTWSVESSDKGKGKSNYEKRKADQNKGGTFANLPTKHDEPISPTNTNRKNPIIEKQPLPDKAFQSPTTQTTTPPLLEEVLDLTSTTPTPSNSSESSNASTSSIISSGPEQQDSAPEQKYPYKKTTKKPLYGRGKEIEVTHFAPVKGWEKSAEFCQYIEHNTEVADDKSHLKNSCIISSPNTIAEEKEIKFNGKENTYLAQKWLYSTTKKPVNITTKMQQEAGIDTSKPSEKRALSEEQIKAIKAAAIKRIIAQEIYNKKIENSEESVAKRTKQVEQQGLFASYAYESPDTYSYPVLRFKGEAVSSTPCLPNNNTDASPVKAEKIEIIEIDTTGRNALDQEQKDYLTRTMELLNGENFFIKNDKLYDLEQVDIRKLTDEQIATVNAVQLPSLAPEKTPIGILQALLELREKTKNTKWKFEALKKNSEATTTMAFNEYYKTCATTNLIGEKETARRKLALIISDNVSEKAENYIQKRNLLIKNAHTKVEKMFESPASTSWFSPSSWGFFSTSTPSSSTPALPSASK